MYHPMHLDQIIRTNQDELRRRNEQARWTHETIEGGRKPRRHRR